MNLEFLRDELELATSRAGLSPSAPGPRPWALFGSAVLLLHGLRDRIGDIDVFVDPALTTVLERDRAWQVRRPDPVDPPFLELLVDGVRVHAFDAWTARDPEVSALQCRATAELVGGWWCTPLPIIRMHKAMSVAKHRGDPRQAKHLPDIAAIDALEVAA